MKELWNSRYNQKDYVYGVNPNEFFKDYLLDVNPGRLLLPAEGEGRNAVFAATKGWNVTAFDFSDSARKKALDLAQKAEVDINYEMANLLDFKAPSNSYDIIALIYVHMPPNLRRHMHLSLNKLLAPEGKIILEAFNKDQVSRNSGGPKDLDMLYSIEELRSDFTNMNIELLNEAEVTLSEGPLHSGPASVIRMIATKRF